MWSLTDKYKWVDQWIWMKSYLFKDANWKLSLKTIDSSWAFQEGLYMLIRLWCQVANFISQWIPWESCWCSLLWWKEKDLLKICVAFPTIWIIYLGRRFFYGERTVVWSVEFTSPGLGLCIKTNVVVWTFTLLRENLVFVPGLHPWLWLIFSSHAIVKTGSFHLFVSSFSFFFWFHPQKIFSKLLCHVFWLQSFNLKVHFLKLKTQEGKGQFGNCYMQNIITIKLSYVPIGKLQVEERLYGPVRKKSSVVWFTLVGTWQCC